MNSNAPNKLNIVCTSAVLLASVEPPIADKIAVIVVPTFEPINIAIAPTNLIALADYSVCKIPKAAALD
jgi:hypothetical protein